LDLVDVIEVVGKGCVNVCERNSGDVRDNLIRRHALVFMPHNNVEHPNAVAGDASFTSADAGVLVIRSAVGVDMPQV